MTMDDKDAVKPIKWTAFVRERDRKREGFAAAGTCKALLGSLVEAVQDVTVAKLLTPNLM